MEFLFDSRKLNAVLENAKDPIIEDSFDLRALLTSNAELIAALDAYPLGMALVGAEWQLKRDGSGSLELSFIEMVDEVKPNDSLQAFTALRTDIESLTLGAYMPKGKPVQSIEFSNLKFEEMARKFDAVGCKGHRRLYRYSFESSTESWDNVDAK